MADRRTDLVLAAIACMDLTSLEDDDTPEKITALAEHAVRPADGVQSVAAVCVYPFVLAPAAAVLAGSGVRLAAVAGGFPSGRARAASRVREIRAALAAGADEIDTVIDHGAFLAGNIEDVRGQLGASREAAGDATMKVILETGAIGDPELVRAAADLAISEGADFLKSSTGKSDVGATPEAVEVLLEAARDAEEDGRPMGVKVAGGVRTADQAIGYLELVRMVRGADAVRPDRFRIGASSLLDALLAELRG